MPPPPPPAAAPPQPRTCATITPAPATRTRPARPRLMAGRRFIASRMPPRLDCRDTEDSGWVDGNGGRKGPAGSDSPARRQSLTGGQPVGDRSVGGRIVVRV